MFHECSWLQIVLFEIGGLFQFIALCAFLRERLSFRHDGPSPVHLDPDYHDEPLPAPRPQISIAQQASTYRVQPVPPPDEIEKPTMNAADLLRTAKVKFKQSFKNRDH